MHILGYWINRGIAWCEHYFYNSLKQTMYVTEEQDCCKILDEALKYLQDSPGCGIF